MEPALGAVEVVTTKDPELCQKYTSLCLKGLSKTQDKKKHLEFLFINCL